MENKEFNPSKIIIILSIIIGAIAAFILLTYELPNKPLAGKGGGDKLVDIGGDFELLDHNGNIFSSDQLKGKLSLIYFGFTYCPDICPTSLQKLSKVMDVMQKYHIDIVPVFITVDPNRDKQKILGEYLRHFHESFIGLTGSDSEIKKVADKFKVYYAVSAGDKPGTKDYMIDHSSFVYLMDKDFKYMQHFYLSNSAEEIIEAVRMKSNLK